MVLQHLIKVIKTMDNPVIRKVDKDIVLVGYSAKVIPALYAERGSEHEGNPQFDWVFSNYEDKELILNNPTTIIPKGSIIILSKNLIK